MKHSIKREQSHARMSFAECENQRSLAEGESNVRATLKRDAHDDADGVGD